MRHNVAGIKLGRKKDVRAALRRNLVKQLFEHERIRTTRAKAEAVRGQAENLITLAKNGNQEGEVNGARPPDRSRTHRERGRQFKSFSMILPRASKIAPAVIPGSLKLDHGTAMQPKWCCWSWLKSKRL